MLHLICLSKLSKAAFKFAGAIVIGYSTLTSSWALETVRVGVLSFGTVNWELDTIQRVGLDRQEGIELKVVPLASGDASTVALQGGAVDVIVSDWLWVARQRGHQRPYRFYPYSNAVGSVMVPASSPIQSLADLSAKRVGVAGGANDKSWLLLRAYSVKTLGQDLQDHVQTQFAAPPLLNQLLLGGDLDAVLNYWHFAAALQAQGAQPLISTTSVLQGLGLNDELPMIGWVFDERWAQQHPEAIAGFLNASYQAKALLLRDDQAWLALKPRIKAKTEAVFTRLRDAYREGIPHCFDAQHRQTAQSAFALFAKYGGTAMLGDVQRLDDAVFWTGSPVKGCQPR